MSKHIRREAPYQTAEFAKTLARTRRERGLTQRELGARLGLPQSHLSLIERGKVDVRLSSLIEMARLLDLEVALVPRRLVPTLRALTEPRRTREDAGFLYRLGDEGGEEAAGEER